MDENAISEIKFWMENARFLNAKGMSIKIDNDCEIEAFSIASGVGYGGYISLCAGALSEGTVVFGAWGPHEKLLSSMYREAEAVRRVLNSKGKLLSGFLITKT